MGFCNAQRGGATTIRRETTQVVPNILWAFAKLKATNGAIELRPDSLVENGNTQPVASTVWACAKLWFCNYWHRLNLLVENGTTQVVCTTPIYSKPALVIIRPFWS